ncbi:MAG TPA: CHAP domain-containing protein [Ktedonobacterales bacterium]|jgi:LysM repeat protein
MGRSGLLRHPAPIPSRQNRGQTWEEEDVTELAYGGEEAWQEEEEWADEDDPAAYQGEDELAEDASQYAERDDDGPSPDALADAEGDGYADDAPNLSEEQAWDDESDEDGGASEERGLVPFHSGQTSSFMRRGGMLIGFDEAHYGLEPGTPLPVFIAGERKTDKIGALGHTLIAPRAHRPRPFFFHAVALAVVMVSLIVTALTVGVLSSGPQFWNNFASLAGSAAPPPPPVKFHRYTVRFGDTAEGIAKTFGVKVGGILLLNGLVDGEQIYTGMSLKVPSDPTYGANFHALLHIPYAPAITPQPPYGSYIAVPGFNSFNVQDYAGDPFGGSFGQCTWWAAHKRPDEYFAGIGDAWSWADGARARGYTVTSTPVPNATVVFQPGVQGALGIGHVGHVEQLLPGGWILISEMNFYWNDGNWGRVDYRYITPGPGVVFIH